MLFPRLLLAFTLVPIVELVLLIQLGRWVGLWPTLAIVIGTGIAGAALARSEGLRAWRAFQEEIGEGRPPARSVMDGLSIFVGGALLLTPGLMTDLVGFSLLLRPSRRWLQDRVLRRLSRRLARGDSRMRVRTWFSWSGPPTEGPPTSPDFDRPQGREVEISERESDRQS